jgi:rfaE bifunctional protein kinase chain/domain
MMGKAALKDRLLLLVDRFAGRKLAVVGDLITDEFLYGQIARVSREAPVLVLQYRDTVRLPGGAANAANNLLALGCRVVVAGVVGSDEAGHGLVRALKERGADTRRILELQSYSTPVKTRILAGAHHSAPQQVVRVDRVAEVPLDLPPMWRSVDRAFGGCDGFIVSDYGYGAASPARALELESYARARSLPVVVDSRFRMSEFYDVTSITPNITELEAATGVAIGANARLLRRAGMRTLRKQRLEFLLVTQGRFGMTLLRPRRAPMHISIYGSDEVADVTGAGDTVIAVFTLALACGGAPEDAARLANYAGGIVVMKRGTATLTCGELQEAVRHDIPSQILK